jgi:hypothetical protein
LSAQKPRWPQVGQASPSSQLQKSRFNLTDGIS